MGDKSQPLPWFRMYHEALDDDKLRLLAFEDRWHYVAILCCKAKGLLDVDTDWGMFQRRIAVRLGVQARELEEIHRRLMEVNLVDESMQPLNWDKRQCRSDHDPTRAERQRRYRDKRVSNALRDGEVTRLEGEGDGEEDTKTHVRSTRTDTRFDEFWQVWPPQRKRDKKKARDVWKRKKLDRMADTIIADVRKRQAEDNQWLRGFVPMPTTYLNGDRWEDVIEPPSGEEETNDPFAGAL